MDNQKTPPISRRSVLRATVAGTTVPFVVSTVSGSSNDDPVVMRRQGSWDEPLDVGKMMDIKREAIREHKRRGGAVEYEEFINAVPRFPNDANLVDYVVGVRKDGLPIQHVGIAGGESSVPSIRRDADEHAQRIRQRARQRGDNR